MDSCFFCIHAPADPACGLEQPVYRLRRYAHQGLVRRFEYDKVVIPVGRCPNCARQHFLAKRRRKTAIGIGALSGFLIGAPIPGALLFTAIIGGFVGHLVAGRRAGNRYRRLGIKPLTSTALKDFPPIDNYLKTGWTLKKR